MPYKDPEVARAKKHANYLAHRAAFLARSTQWRKDHPEQARAIVKRSKHKHPEKVRAYSQTYNRQYYALDPEKQRARAKQYYAADPEASRARNATNRAKRREENRLYNQIYGHARRAQKRGAENRLTHDQWLLIQEAQDHCCAYCGKRCKGKLTQDHITPLSKGGTHTLHNVIGACQSCNSRKHVGPPLVPVQPLLL